MQRWHLRNIILVTLLAIFLGVIFWAITPLYTVLTAVLVPFGLSSLANDLLLGVWVMAGPLAGYLIRIPGAAILGEFLGSVVEMFLGNAWGAGTLISGALQGLGAELGFTMTRYRHYNWLTLLLSALTTTIVTFAWSLIKEGYGAYHFQLLALLLGVRFLSIFCFSGILTHLIANLLVRAHVLDRA